MSEFATFQKYKEKEKQAMIERNSGKTLEIYNLIDEIMTHYTMTDNSIDNE